jgi:hypothetical protein
MRLHTGRLHACHGGERNISERHMYCLHRTKYMVEGEELRR